MKKRADFIHEKKLFIKIIDEIGPAFKREKNAQALSDGVGIVKEITDLQKKKGGDFFFLEQGDFSPKKMLGNKAIAHLAIAREEDFHNGWSNSMIYNLTSKKMFKNLKPATNVSEVNKIIKTREEMMNQYIFQKNKNIDKINEEHERAFFFKKDLWGKINNNVVEKYNPTAKIFSNIETKSYIIESLNDPSHTRKIGQRYEKEDILWITGVDINDKSKINEFGVAAQWATNSMNVDTYIKTGMWNIIMNTEDKKGIIIDINKQINELEKDLYLRGTDFFQSKEYYDVITQAEIKKLRQTWYIIDSFAKCHGVMVEEGIEQIYLDCGDWSDLT